MDRSSRTRSRTAGETSPDDTGPGPMETLSEALERLVQRGFQRDFRPGPGGCLTLDGETMHEPESLRVEEVVRFEGTSDPEDEAVLFAITSADGRERGTFASSYGTVTDPNHAEAVRRLPAPTRPTPPAMQGEDA